MTKEKAGPVRLEAKGAGLIPSLLSKGKEYTYFISYLLSLFKSPAGVGMEGRKHDIIRLIRMQTCRLYLAPDTPFHSSLETEDCRRNLLSGKEGEKAKDIYPLFN